MADEPIKPKKNQFAMEIETEVESEEISTGYDLEPISYDSSSVPDNDVMASGGNDSSEESGSDSSEGNGSDSSDASGDGASSGGEKNTGGDAEAEGAQGYNPYEGDVSQGRNRNQDNQDASDKKDGKESSDKSDLDNNEHPDAQGYDPDKKPDEKTPEEKEKEAMDQAGANQGVDPNQAGQNPSDPNHTNPNGQNPNGQNPNGQSGNKGQENPNSQAAGSKKSSSPNQPGKNDAGTKYAGGNNDINKRIANGKKAENGIPKKPATPANPAGGAAKKAASTGAKKAAGEGAKKAAGAGAKKVAAGAGKTLASIGGKVIAMIAANPGLAIGVGLVIFIIVLLILSSGSLNNTSRMSPTGGRCNYKLKGVASSEVSLTNLSVELVNCDATADNYTVLAHVDFEKYVIGVALAEIGSDAPDEALKAQIVAARNFALTRNSGMCPGNIDNCFYGYNPSTGVIRMRACEADQVYWNFNYDSYRKENGSISYYTPEVDQTTGTLWKSALSEDRVTQIYEIANSVKGVVLLDSEGSVYKTAYDSSISNTFISKANEGKTYKEILNDTYSSESYNTAVCSDGGLLDYGDYVLSSEGTTVITERLDNFLSKQGSSIEKLNEQIEINVDEAGYGTRAGVVMAAVTLIGEMGNYGVRIPYYWGGGHYDGVVVGTLGYWGSTDCSTYANNKHYNRCGLDCSGFVPWAIKNGGFNMSQMLAGGFKDISGAKKVNLKSNEAVLQPGDLLESTGHITLVVGVDDANKQYIIAHAGGLESGVSFTRFSFKPDGYWGVDMTDYYNDPVHYRSR